MSIRPLLVIALMGMLSPCQLCLAQQTTATVASSYVQATGTGVVSVKPTRLRLSIPVVVVEGASWDATEKLREVRQQIVDRANEMGVIEGTLKTVGFQCSPQSASSSNNPFGAPNATGETEEQFAAKCYIIADFRIGQLEDYEAMLAMSQSQLEELASLVPKQSGRRRSYPFMTLSSGLSSQMLETPLVFFVGDVTEQQRREAFKAAIEQGQKQVEMSLQALGIESSQPASISQHSSYSSSRTQHPAENAIYPPEKDEAVGLYPDSLTYRVRLGLNTRFDAGK